MRWIDPCAGLVLCALLMAAPARAQLPYSETFDGTDGDPWPAPWTTQSFYLLESDLQADRGRMSGQAANGSGAAVARMLLPGFSATDVEAVMTLEFENVAIQGIGFYARQNGGTLQEYAPFGQGYAMFLKGGWGWPQDLGIWREVGGIETQFATGYNPIAGGLQNGVRYRARFRVTQHTADTTRIQAKVWPEADAEPASWTVDVFDSHPALQGTGGGFAFDCYNFQGTDHVFIDDLQISAYPPTVSAQAVSLPAGIALSAPWPNPAGSRAYVACTSPAPAHARLRVFDAAGRVAGIVHEGAVEAGRSVFEWRPESRLAPGVYHLVLEAGDVRVARRIVVTR